MCERATLPLEQTLKRVAGIVQDDPLLALRTLAVDTLLRLATDPRAQAVFEVMYHKSELTNDLAPIGARRDRERCDCLAHVELMVQRAVEVGQLAADTDTRLATVALHTYLGGIMREWVLDPAAFDLAHAAPALIDVVVAGLRANPPRRIAPAPRRHAPPRRERLGTKPPA
jgi:TetR/AcrR family acrAB operon transcriptional repressor